jgi:hypothetical protein
MKGKYCWEICYTAHQNVEEVKHAKCKAHIKPITEVLILKDDLERKTLWHSKAKKFNKKKKLGEGGHGVE